MQHELPALPYAVDALAPHISAETFEYHYGKHHRAYVTNLNNLIKGTEFENATLEDIIRKSSGGIFNNAAQVWNHTFFWNSMKPGGGGKPSGALAAAIDEEVGLLRRVQGGLHQERRGQLRLGLDLAGEEGRRLGGHRQHQQRRHAAHHRRQGARSPIDVWEHAYYIDYRNARPKFVEAFLGNLVNWDFAAKNFA